MKFEKGHKKVGGRQRGTPNKNSRLGQEVAQEILMSKKYRKYLRRRMTNPQLYDAPPPALEALIWAYGFGRPIDPNRGVRAERNEAERIDADDSEGGAGQLARVS